MPFLKAVRAATSGGTFLDSLSGCGGDLRFLFLLRECSNPQPLRNPKFDECSNLVAALTAQIIA